jgi:hypothetical protein
MLLPIPEGDCLDRLEKEGVLSRAEGDLLEAPPLPPVPGVIAPSKALEQFRAGEHFRAR